MPAPLSTPTTLVLSRAYIAACAKPIDYIDAVQTAFADLANGALQSLPVGHIPGDGGGFHLKSARAQGEYGQVAIKINGNFPDNPTRNGLPTIQGCIVLSDAGDGRLLAVLDSIEITAQRTAAASAVAARWLARRESTTLAFVGCGVQAHYHLDALLALPQFTLRNVHCFDLCPAQSADLAARVQKLGLQAHVASSVSAACRDADIVVTTTPSRRAIVHAADIRPGSFIAAVGADNPDKNELAPDLLAIAHLVPDLFDQAACMGELRSALASGVMQRADVHAELAQIVTGTRPGRTDPAQIFVFDSTGTAIQDLAAARLIHARASRDPDALRVAFGQRGTA